MPRSCRPTPLRTLGWPHAPWPREPNDHAYIPDRLRGVIADRQPEAQPFA